MDDYNNLRPLFKDLRNNPNSMGCSQISIDKGIPLHEVIQMYSRFLVDTSWKDYGNPNLIKVVILTPDGQMNTYNGKNQIITRLSGEYTDDLYNEVLGLANKDTLWDGFNLE